MKKLPLIIAVAAVFPINSAIADVVHQDDTIITGSLCAGFDCVNGESFGFDTIRLKENNLRLHFQDTSSSASFPTNDWRIVANDSSNGGSSYLAFEDSDAGRTPFKVMAGSPANSLFVNSSGNIGLGTSNPVVEIHVADGDSPTLRLEQDGSSGFTPQVWDVAGNETNFFIRDATNGSALSFRIRAGAPANSIFIDTDGDIGLGTASPSAALDVIGTAEINGAATINGATTITASDNTTALTIRETNAVMSQQTMLSLQNNGIPVLEFKNTATTGTEWNISPNVSGNFLRINSEANANNEVTISNTGDITALGNISGVNGVFTGTMTVAGVQVHSSRALKEDIIEADSVDILSKLNKLPLMTWKYKNNAATHIGPMAEDFNETFGYGTDNKSVSVGDLASIAVVGVKALNQQLNLKDQKIEGLEQRLADLENLIISISQNHNAIQKTSLGL